MTKKESKKNEIDVIVDKFKELYKEKFGVYPSVNYAWCGKMIKSLLEDHSAMGLVRIVELYFEYESDKVYHLPSILSAYSVNKYLPMIKLDPKIYANADELNKDIY